MESLSGDNESGIASYSGADLSNDSCSRKDSFTSTYMTDFSDSQSSHTFYSCLNNDCSKSSMSCNGSTRTNFICRTREPKFNCKQCLSHGEPLKFFCVSCSVSICRECVLLIHSNCAFKPLKSYVRKLYDSIVAEDEFYYKELKETILNVRHSFEHKVNYIKNVINNITKQIMLDVEEGQKDLLDKLGRIEKLKVDSWQKQTDICMTVLHKLNGLRQHSKIWDFRDINIIQKNISLEVGGYLDFIEDDNINFMNGYLPFNFFGKITGSPSLNCSQVALPVQSFVNRFNTCRISVKDHIGQPVIDIHYKLGVLLENHKREPVYFIINNFKNGDYDVRFYPITQGKHTLWVYLNDVSVAGSPYELWVSKDESVGFAAEITLPGEFSMPWGIASDGEGRLYIVDRGHSCIKVYTEEGVFVFEFGSEGSESGQFLRPAGIAIDRKKRRIFIADKDNHRIQIFKYDGTYISQFGEKGSGDGELLYPWDVAISHSGLVAVSDTRNCRVQFFGESGRYICQFSFNTKCTHSGGELELPRGLAFRSDDSLLITDFNKHAIVMIDKDLKTIKKCGSGGYGVTQFFRPQSISVDADGRFAVADGRNNRIQIFEPNGELCAILGQSGTENKEMKTPHGVCLLENGCIVVAELEDSRVRILKYK